MRTKPPAKNPTAPQEREKPRSPGSKVASPLAGVAAACALAGGCAASGPAVRPGPPPRQLCPPDAVETMKREFKIAWDDGYYALLSYATLLIGPPRKNPHDPVIVTEGRHEVFLWEPNKFGGGLPDGSVLIGDFLIRDRLYARFVEVRLPDGRRFPFCGHLEDRDTNDWGASFLPDSKPGAMKVWGVQYVEATYHDH